MLDGDLIEDRRQARGHGEPYRFQMNGRRVRTRHDSADGDLHEWAVHRPDHFSNRDPACRESQGVAAVHTAPGLDQTGPP
jgi:hypothetical protein